MRQTADRVTVEEKHTMKDFRLGDTMTRVLKGISLQVMQEEFVSMMRPSGSEKSTPLYILGGLNALTGSQVLLDGTDISWSEDKKMSRIRRQNIGFVFQFYNLTPNLSVEENIPFPLLLDGKKMERCQKRLGGTLEAISLMEHRKHTSRGLSGGQQQWMAIACALVGEPATLFADEPTGNLGSRTGAGIMNLLWGINQSIGQTIIMATHSPETTKSSDRIITVQDGVFV